MTTSQLFDSSGSLLQSEPNEQDLAGVIKWLPKKPELEGRGIETSSLGIEEGAYGHPVVILSPRPENGWVQALLVSSRSMCRWCGILQTIKGMNSESGS